jgi:hypothetical protein
VAGRTFPGAHPRYFLSAAVGPANTGGDLFIGAAYHGLFDTQLGVVHDAGVLPDAGAGPLPAGVLLRLSP